jgi:hypothetical protein
MLLTSAAADRHFYHSGRAPQRAVAHLGDRRNVLGLREPNAKIDACFSIGGRKIEDRDTGKRISAISGASIVTFPAAGAPESCSCSHFATSSGFAKTRAGTRAAMHAASELVVTIEMISRLLYRIGKVFDMGILLFVIT